MNRRSVQAILTASLFLGLLAVALWEVHSTRKATSDLGQALDRRSNLEAQIRRTEKLAAEASGRASLLNSRLAVLRAAAKRVANFEDDLRILAELSRPWREIVLCRDPKLQALYLQSEHAAIPRRYAPFASALGLTPAQAAKLDAAMLADTEQSLDIRASAQSQGLDPSDPAVVTLLNQSQDQLKETLTDLLGGDGYSALQDYQRTLPTRDFVNTLAGELAFTDSPLNASQADQLVAELSAANISYQNGGPAVSPRLTDYNAIMATQSLAQEPVDWDSIEPHVQTFLSPTQFSLVKASVQNSVSTAELYNLLVKSSPSPLLGFSYSWKAP